MRGRVNKCNSQENLLQEVAARTSIAHREVLAAVNQLTEIVVVEMVAEEETFQAETSEYIFSKVIYSYPRRMAGVFFYTAYNM